MKGKRIVVSWHAEQRLLERGITLDMVRRTMILGEEFPTFTRPGAPQRQGRRLAFGARVVRVVWVEHWDSIHLVTAMWQTDEET